MKFLLTVAVAVSVTTVADAGPLRRLFHHRHQPSPAQCPPISQPPQATPAVAFSSDVFFSHQSLTVQTATPDAVPSDPLTAVVNRYRQAAGLRPLVTDASLTGYAQNWSQTMTRTGMRHSTGWVQFGGLEVVAAGQGSVEEVVRDWLNSPGHRAALMAPNVTRFGGGRAGAYWCGVTGR